MQLGGRGLGGGRLGFGFDGGGPLVKTDAMAVENTVGSGTVAGLGFGGGLAAGRGLVPLAPNPLASMTPRIDEVSEVSSRKRGCKMGLD